LGALLLFIFAGNDVMHSLGLIQTGYISSFGLLSFILFQNYMTYVRFIQDAEDKVSLTVKANQDPLTSLLNRRGLMEAFELAQSNKRYKTDHFSVMLIDFDHFKTLNDTLGHDVGDQVLAEGSKIMIELIRKYDLAVRWGGEEFVIVLPNTKLHGAITLAEKIRIALSVRLSEIVQHPITASFGVAENSPQESLTDCLKRADIALYKAKKAGRNSVVAAELQQTEVKA
jgi:diguanylate cyclase (GGDEF)-like protein